MIARTPRGALALGAVACIALAVACSPPAKGELDLKTGTRASPNSFRVNGVNIVFEKRCGSLDCHGSPARNLRIYSSRGLRLPNDAGIAPGVGDTTLEEITASYQSIIALEPEATNAVIDGADPSTLQILKKPLETEKHKGGPVIRKNDDAERCIASWFREGPLDPIDKTACAAAANFPKE
jgi:hypothetical protein